MSTVEPRRYNLSTSWTADVLELAEQLVENVDTEGLIDLVKRIDAMEMGSEFGDEMRCYFNQAR